MRALALVPGHARAWSGLCQVFQALEGDDAAAACGARGVAAGVWERAEQRPGLFYPGVPNAVPWPDLAGRYPGVKRALDALAVAWEASREEALALLEVEGAGGLHYGTMEALEERPDDAPGSHGRWHSRKLACFGNSDGSGSGGGDSGSGGSGSGGNTNGNGGVDDASAPATCAAVRLADTLLRKALLSGISDASDAAAAAAAADSMVLTAQFLRLEPGGFIRPHCGSGNYRWVAHLGLVIPEGVSITVAGEQRRWEEGGVLTFDDSFVHSVRHNGTSDRLILAIQLTNPEYFWAQRGRLSS
eukprot:m.444955 g.444955  ORF g.444955 m.444955 type:complete len:302 (-) comp20300_c18_seq2:262-1167(-)